MRWLALTLLLLAGIVLAHAWVIARHAAQVSELVRKDVRISLPYQLVRPEFTVDGHMWIRYADQLIEGDDWRLRETRIDNAPAGREVHWNSGYAWWLALGAWSWHQATDLPLSLATEKAAMWVNAPLLIGFAVLFMIWAARREGLAIGIMVGLSVVFSPNLYEGFYPGYTDHHGIALGSLLGFALGAFWMRGGWLPRDRAGAEIVAMSAARWSGWWGGVALWISAASASPVIALVAASALFATAMTDRSAAARYVYSPQVWRVWGRTGALVSFGFYLVEYIPFHVGWRLEVNHPLYALAWWAGSELVAVTMPLLALSPRRAEKRKLAVTAVWALPLAVAPAVVIGIWRSAVFLPLDPFLAGLHRTITEFMPLTVRVEVEGLLPHLNAAILMPLVYLGGVVGLWLCQAGRWNMLFSLGVALPLFVLGVFQTRWSMSAAIGEVLVLICLARTLLQLPGLAAWRWRVPVLISALLLIAFGLPAYFRAREAHLLATARGITAGDARQLIYREVAQVIRDSQPEGEVVVFGSPNTSVNVAFFGGFKTLGTLYWENVEGLKAAAAISSARTEEEAARLIKAHGVTHLAFFRDGNYILEYAKLLNPESTAEEVRRTFGYRLLGARVVPLWLEALPYAAPDGLPEGVDREVLVFRVNFDQTPAQAAYSLAALQARRQESADALQTYAQVLKLDPTNYPAALRRGEILIGQKKWDEAEENFDRAVVIAPAEERYRLLTQVGLGFDSVLEPTRAVFYYERAMREAVTNTVAPNNLAWILATAENPALRNPARAIELAQRCVALQPGSPPMLGTLAAAQASAGNFVGAVATLEEAMALARRQGALNLLPQMEERAADYRAGRLWLPR